MSSNVTSAMHTISHALDVARADKEQWEAERKGLLAHVSKLEKQSEQHLVTEANMARRIKMLELALQQRSASPPIPTTAINDTAAPAEEAAPDERVPLLPEAGDVARLKVWEEWRDLTSLRCHLDMVRTVCFHPSDPILCSGSADATLKIWNLASLARGENQANELEVAFTLRGHTAGVNCSRFRMAGRQIVSGSDDGTVRVWAVPGSEESLYSAFGRSILHQEKVLDKHVGPVRAVLVHPISDSIFTISDDRTVRSWVVGSSDTHGLFELVASPEAVPVSACFATTMSSCVVGYSTGELVGIDQETMKQSSAMRLAGSDATVLSVVGHRTLPLVVAGHADGKIACFDLRTGKVAKQMQGAHAGGVHSVDLDRSGLCLVSGGDDCKVRLWDIGQWAELEVHESHVGGGSGCGVLDTVFHPEKRVLASAGADSTVRIYNQQGLS